jgi:type II secretory pathway pseudopilin PulG
MAPPKATRAGITSVQMKRGHLGFSIVELMISMVMFLLVISATTQFFSSQFDQFKRQSRIAESNVEGIIGLEMMRIDISHAGFGLPWQLNGAEYTEAKPDGGSPTPWVDTNFNDGPPGNPTRGIDSAGDSNPPGAVRSGNSNLLTGSTLYNSDVLVLKASNVAQNAESQKWTRIGLGDNKRVWDPSNPALYDFEDKDRIIILSPADRILQLSDADGVSWSTTYDATTNFDPAGEQINIIYGINSPPAAPPRFPFNRTEYYIKIPATMPSGCAMGTGVLYRSTLNYDDEGFHTESPILDCVADLQVVYRFNDGTPRDGNYTFYKTAKEIRDEIRSVTVYILAQEGQKDPDFDLEDSIPDGKIMVGPNTGEGREYDFKNSPTNNIEDWQNYRWKVYTVSATLHNLD